MITLIKYKLDGTIVDEDEIELNNLNNILGMKVRCTYQDGREEIGYFSLNENYYKNNKKNLADYIELWTLKDFNKNKPNDMYDQEFKKLETNNLIKVEAILHSNPRWGTTPSNDFEFNKTISNNDLSQPLKTTKEYIDGYFGKDVVVISNCKNFITKGHFISYQRPEDNEEECWTIDIEQDGTIYSFLETEIDDMFLDKKLGDDNYE